MHNDGIVSTKAPQLLEDKKEEDTETEDIEQPGIALCPKREDEFEDD